MASSDRFDWKLFAVLLAACLLGVASSLPFALELVDRFVPEAEHREIEAQLPLPVPLLILLALIQNSVVFGGAIAAGMALAPRVGTGAPIIAAWVHRRPMPEQRSWLLGPIAVGLLLGVTLAVIDAVLFLPRAPAELQELSANIPRWKRLLAGVLYGGVAEELLMRWFLLSLGVWILAKLWRGEANPAPAGAWWTANVFVALLFGLGHLPLTQAVAPLTPLVVTRCLVLNGAASLTFGFLFWKRGLEAAMISHASTHLGMQVWDG